MGSDNEPMTFDDFSVKLARWAWRLGSVFGIATIGLIYSFASWQAGTNQRMDQLSRELAEVKSQMPSQEATLEFRVQLENKLATIETELRNIGKQLEKSR